MAGKPSSRQMEAFRLRCAGMKYSEIGAAMGISPVTANVHARVAARRLIRSKVPSNADDRRIAIIHFPRDAQELGAT